MANVIARPLSILFESSWRSKVVPIDWKKANVTLTLKKGKKEDPRNYRLVKLISVLGKMIEINTPGNLF